MTLEHYEFIVCSDEFSDNVFNIIDGVVWEQVENGNITPFIEAVQKHVKCDALKMFGIENFHNEQTLREFAKLVIEYGI